MRKIHIQKDGLYDCGAEIGRCPVSPEEEHFYNVEDARKFYQKTFGSQFVVFDAQTNDGNAVRTIEEEH